MESIKRIFVEKKELFAQSAKSLEAELSKLLKINNIKSLRTLIRYDIQFISEDIYEKALWSIFADSTTDILHIDKVEDINNEDTYILQYELLLGQFDQRADSAIQCLRLLGAENPIVRTSNLIIIQGNLTDEEKSKIENYLINPVESKKSQEEIPKSLQWKQEVNDSITVLTGFKNADEIGLNQFKQEYQFSLSIEELIFVQSYFAQIDRDPTITEIKVLDTYWSDHCRHTTFNTILEDIVIDEHDSNDSLLKAFDRYKEIRSELYADRKDKDITLMDIATIGAKYLKKHGYLEDLEESKEINACSIIAKVPTSEGEQDWLIMFKNETHNHPTEIEPFGGAATCLGGAIRDPLSGRGYVYQAMRITGAGDPFTAVEDTLTGKLPQIKITRTASDGYSSYGNQIGVPSGYVNEIYHPGYVAKRMELGAVVAAVPLSDVRREEPVAGDIIILIGGRTGRDGIGGAVGSSQGHTEDSLTECGAEVQKGNAPIERSIQRLFRNPEMTLLIKKSNDFGAGGVAVAIGELADGLDIFLDEVPLKYEGLDGTEIAISESQERMAIVVEAKDKQKVLDLASSENLEATHVATVTSDNKMTIYWKGAVIVDIDRAFLDTNGITQYAKINVTSKDMHSGPFAAKLDNKNSNYEEILYDSITGLNSCSQKGLIDKFDSTAGGNTVLMPLGGKNQITPSECMAAKIPAINVDTDYCTVMSYGFFPEIGEWSCFAGGAHSVLSSISKIVCTGGNYRDIRLSFQEYFESLADDPKRWGKPFEALLGALSAQLEFKTAAIGGKDSMSGSFNDMDVPPTLVSFAITHMNAADVISSEFKKANNTVILFEMKTLPDGSPDFAHAKHLFNVYEKMSNNKLILSASTVKSKGIAEAVLKMAFGNDIGFKFTNNIDKLDKALYSSIVAEVDSSEIDLDALKDEYLKEGIHILGHTQESQIIEIDNVSVALSKLYDAYTSFYESIYPTKTETEKPNIIEKLYTKEKYNIQTKKSNASIVKPKVLIPIFTGTNGEYEMTKAFVAAGAQCKPFVFVDRTLEDIKQSFKLFEEEILKSNIIVIPGGSSLGDQPDGAGKYIAAILKEERIKNALYEALYNKDALMLGICNGFQSLIRTGLVPFGKMEDLPEDRPVIATNSIGRAISSYVKTKLISKASPWHIDLEIGEIECMPANHAEGRFVCSQSMYESLLNNGQIATVYVDDSFNASYDIQHNPNGSYYAVEGITSPDGRILAKMGHNERTGDFISKNVPNCNKQKIFTSAVKYFS